jgi:ArsR family transcriptional regulator, arsenate/arsenite/antimonite-responsive transcriptional repressor
MSSNLDAISKVFDQATPLFFALGASERQSIIMHLAEEESMSVGQLARLSTLSRPAISHHLKILRAAHLVAVEKRGTENWYSLTMEDSLELLKKFVVEVEQCV